MSKQRVRDQLYYLESTGKVSSVALILGTVVRKLYCLPKHRDQVEKLIHDVSTEIKSFLKGRLVVVTPELFEYSKDRLDNANIGLVRMVLNLLTYENKIGRLPFLTSKNRMAYFYFLNTKKFQVMDHLNNLWLYFEKNKYCNATLASRSLGIELNEASYFLRHLVYIGQLNAIVTGYISEYGRCTFVFYVPGYREVVEKRRKIERENEYIDYSAKIFDFLVNQMKLENKADAIENSCRILRVCIEKGILRGRDLDKLAIGCFVLSLRKQGISATVAEILEHLQVLDVGNISKYHILAIEKVIAQELGLALHHFPRYKHYIERFVNDLNLPHEEQQILMQKSLEVFSCIPRSFIVGKKPTTIAAATIYAAANILREIMKYGSPWITQRELSTVSDVTEVSLRNHYRTIEAFYKTTRGSG